MKVGIVQFAPDLRVVDQNIERAESLIKAIHPGQVDILVLPELALTGYNYSSLADIRPFLEPTARGVSTEWAKRTASRLRCLVTIGYPEICTDESDVPGRNTAHETAPNNQDKSPRSVNGTNGSSKTKPVRTYNSLVTVDASGAILAHYRKTNLYYTDVSWSWPNPDGFGTKAWQLPLNPSSKPGSIILESLQSNQADKVAPSRTPTAFAICMDFNPKHFIAPFEDYELATHILNTNAKLLIASNAWLTHKTREELKAAPKEYDPSTLSYWAARLRPLIDHGGGWRADRVSEANGVGEECNENGTAGFPHIGGITTDKSSERIIVIANRVGIEPGGLVVRDLTLGRPPDEHEYGGDAPDDEKSRQAGLEQESTTAALAGAEPTAAVPVSATAHASGSAGDEARYAGSSCVLGLRGDGSIRVYGNLGRAEEKVLIVDTDDKPAWIGRLTGAQ